MKNHTLATIADLLPFFAVVAILLTMIVMLFLDLQMSRNNERELSRMLYQAGKSGHINTNSINPK